MNNTAFIFFFLTFAAFTASAQTPPAQSVASAQALESHVFFATGVSTLNNRAADFTPYIETGFQFFGPANSAWAVTPSVSVATFGNRHVSAKKLQVGVGVRYSWRQRLAVGVGYYHGITLNTIPKSPVGKPNFGDDIGMRFYTSVTAKRNLIFAMNYTAGMVDLRPDLKLDLRSHTLSFSSLFKLR